MVASQRAQDGGAGRMKAVRRGTALFHAAAMLLRLLAALARAAPTVFLEADGGILLERCCEAARFVLLLTSLGGAECALFRRALGAVRPPPGLYAQRAMTEAALAAPALSCLADLQKAFAARSGDFTAAGREDPAAVFARTLPWGAGEEDEAREKLRDLLQTVAPAEEGSQGGGGSGGGAEAAGVPPQRPGDKSSPAFQFAVRVGEAAARRLAAEAARGAAPVPEEFRDPISAEVMTDPVRLPSGHTVDRATALRCIMQDKADPFTRAPLAAEQLEPAGALLCLPALGGLHFSSVAFCSV